MASKWYLKLGTEKHGPFPASHLKKLAEDGKIKGDTLLRKENSQQWIPATKLKGLGLQRPSQEKQKTESQNVDPVDAGNMPLWLLALIGIAFVVFGVIGTLAFVGTQDGEQNDKVTQGSKSSNGNAQNGGFINSLLSPSSPPTTEEIVSEVEDSVALIEGKQGNGSGFLISENFVATNAHVIETEFISDIKVHFPSAQTGPYEAGLIYENTSKDLAFLSVNASHSTLQIAEDHEFSRGEEIIVIGSPGVDELILRNAVSKGVMSTETKLEGRPYYQLDISINPGNSGGPVFDSYGKVIGVATMKAAKQERLAFSIPLETIHAEYRKAHKQSADDQAKNESYHRARVIFRKTAAAAYFHSLVMETYVSAMGTSIRNGGSASDGLQAARNELDRSLGKIAVSRVKQAVSKAAQDEQLSEQIRTKLVDLWTNYKSLRSYVKDPRGSYNSYRSKLRELDDTRQELNESLSLLLGVELGISGES